MAATHDSSFNFKVNTDGSGNESSDAKSIAAGQHILVLVWNYLELPAAGAITYSKDGGAAVSAGAPVQVRSRDGNSDRAAAFIIRNPGAGSYVINSIGLDYLGLSAHVFNAKANFWLRVSSGAAGEGTGTTFTSGSVTPRFESSVAYGYWTHNTDGGGTSAMTMPGGWTLAVGPNTVVHKVEDYDGASQPGGAAYRNITDSGDTKTPITFAPTCANSTAYLSLLVIISEPDTEYVIAGGTDGRCFFGNDALGGRITAPVVLTFEQPIPAGQGIVIFQTRYNQTPTDAAEWSAAGSGNTVLFASNAQRAHDSAGSNDNSVNYFYFVTASECASVTYDASGLPAGDNGRYGQIVVHVTERPDTVNGFYTATGAVNTQTSVSTINFSTFTLPTTNGYVMKGTATRNHADQLCPVTQSPSTAPTYLTHPYFDDIPQPAADYPSGFQNSVIASGACTSQVITGGGTLSGHTWTLTGPSPTTGSAGSVMTAFNLQGGSPPGADVAGPLVSSTARLKSLIGGALVH